jgi:integral membrane sensor domain MASE1
MRRFSPAAPRFERVKETVAFLVAAALMSVLVPAATVGVLSAVLPNEVLTHHGWSGGWWNTTRRMGLCDIVTLLSIVPGILVWAAAGQSAIQKLQVQHIRNPLLLALFFIPINAIVFTRHETPLYLQSTLFLFPMLCLLWAAVRFGSRGAATAL